MYSPFVVLSAILCGRQGEQNPAAALLREVSARTGRLVALWQSVGFVHGVLNTDNMSILGDTIDYGPFGFLERFDTHYTPNASDSSRRYSFRNQVDVRPRTTQPPEGIWNVSKPNCPL